MEQRDVSCRSGSRVQTDGQKPCKDLPGTDSAFYRVKCSWFILPAISGIVHQFFRRCLIINRWARNK